MREFINGHWFYSEDEIDKAYNQGYSDGKELALEETTPQIYEPAAIKKEIIAEIIEDKSKEWDVFGDRSEKYPYHDIWSDNSRMFGFFKNPFCKFHLTKSKIVIQKGFTVETSEPILLYRVIKSIPTIKLWQRFFHIGDIVVKTSKHEYILKNVYHPKQVNAVILKFVDMNRKDRVRISEWSSERDDD